MTSYWKTDLGSSAIATSKIQRTNFETSFWLGNFLHTRHTTKNEHHFAMNRSCTHWHAGPDSWFLIFMFPRRTGSNPNTLRSAWRQVPAIKCHAPGKTQCGIYKLQWLWKQWQTRLELTGTAAAGAYFCHKTQRYVCGNFRQWGTSVQPRVQSKPNQYVNESCKSHKHSALRLQTSTSNTSRSACKDLFQNFIASSSHKGLNKILVNLAIHQETSENL